jgi:hypothetical protein
MFEYTKKLFAVHVLFICVLLFFQSCIKPTESEISDDGIPNFELDIEFDSTQRIINEAIVYLSWSDIPVDHYEETKILRYNKMRDPDSYAVNESDGGWVTIATFKDELRTTWIDTITDDAHFIYQIKHFDKEGNYIITESEIVARETKHILIPSDMTTVHEAIESYIIDDGDSILLEPGEYNYQEFSFGEKDILLEGIAGANNTLIRWVTSTSPAGKPMFVATFVELSQGELKGVSIIEGKAGLGGGVNASGTAIVRNCLLKNNYAVFTPHIPIPGEIGSKGGSLYLSGEARIENCIIFNDRDIIAYDTGIYIDENADGVKLINCTLVNNDLSSLSKDVLIENNIFTTDFEWDVPPPSYDPVNSPDIKYSYAGNIWAELDSTNITGELQFLSFPNDLHLSPISIGIDAGNPNIMYNDIDGTRNDIGAYGGPYGNW